MSSGFKLDKETLIKHRFWVALCLVVPLLLVPWLVLWLSVGHAIEIKKDDYKKSVTAIEGVKDPKNPNYVNPMTKKKGELEAHKGKVWGELYNGPAGYPWFGQSDLAFEWPFDPTGKTPKLAAMANEDFGGPFDPSTKKPVELPISERQEYRENLYKKFKDDKRAEFLALAGPMTMDFDQVIGLPQITEHPEYVPTTEDLWLTQETVWVKRELLRLLGWTLYSVGALRPVAEAKPEPMPTGVVRRLRYRNSNWELDLQVRKGDRNQVLISKDSTIRNINANKRTLPLREVNMQLMQVNPNDPSRPRHGPLVVFQGDPIAWGDKPRSLGHDVRVDQFPLNVLNDKDEIYGWQDFTWGTSPIKQIDVMALGYQSSRTAFQDMMSMRGKDEDAAAAAATTTTTSTTVGVGGGLGGGKFMGAGDSGGGAARGSGSPLGINNKRYIQVTPQVRRVPIGIVLVMDQAYVEDLMAVFVNSRLRFLPTQLQWQQDTRGIKQPDSSEPGNAAPNVVAGGLGKMQGGGAMAPPGGFGMMPAGKMPAGMMTGGGGGMMGGMIGGSRPPTGMMPPGGVMPGAAGPAGVGVPGAAATAATSGAGVESDPNLIEFALSGVISLYDRWRDPNAQAATATTPPTTPTTPKTEGEPKADEKKDGEPKAVAPKAEEKKAEGEPKAGAPKADEKKADEKPTGGEAKKADDNKGN